MKISDLTAIAGISDPSNTYLPAVVESDVSQTPSGTNKKISIQDILNATGGTNFVLVASTSDLPDAVAGVRTLADNTVYYITTTIDLEGDRLVAGSNTVITGASSEVSRLTSTGLGAGAPLLTATDVSLPMQNITFQDVDTALAINASGNADAAFDWYGVNFLNVPNIGTLANGNNFIYINGAFLNSKGMVFDGTFNTVAFDTSLFQGDGLAGSIMSILATATIQRRFRVIYSSFVAFGSTTALDVSTSATIPVEGYILDTVNFAGGGTYLSGIDYTSDKARFVNCRGIENTSVVAGLSMINNATATVIGSVGVAVKVAGTTTANSLNQKFTHTNNRLTYTGGLTRTFKVTMTASVISGNNNQIGLYVAKNGVEIPASEIYVTTDTGGRAQSVAIQALLQLETGDYIELFTENATSVTNVTVGYLNTIINAIE